MRNSAKGWGKAEMLLNRSPAIHHTPAVTSVGHSSVSALYSLLTHSLQDVKGKEGDKPQ